MPRATRRGQHGRSERRSSARDRDGTIVRMSEYCEAVEVIIDRTKRIARFWGNAEVASSLV